MKACKKKSVEALKSVNYRPQRDEQRCIGCGECVLNCPNAAWTRSKTKYYRLTLFGRTGKRNPRLGEDFIKWVDEDSIIKIILNTYDYVKNILILTLQVERSISVISWIAPALKNLKDGRCEMLLYLKLQRS